MSMKIALLAIIVIFSQLTLAYGQSAGIEATGSILAFKESPHSGLWAANVDLESNLGDIVSVFKNENGDIFVVTVRGVEVSVDDDALTMSGKGFVARNGELLKEGDGSALVTKDLVEIRVNDDVLISGITISFEVK